MKVLILLLLCMITICVCGYWAFETGKVWQVSGKQSFDNSSDTIAFVTSLENLESTNSLIYKNIELSGKGTEVDYILDFKDKPSIPEGTKISNPERAPNTRSWHFLGSALIAAVLVFILFVIYGVTEPNVEEGL